MNNLPKRKQIRLKNFDYSSNGAYFITICVKDMQCILSSIVGSGAPDAPKVILTPIGEEVKNAIESINKKYQYIKIKSYVLMPNHIHVLLTISRGTHWAPEEKEPAVSGRPMGAPTLSNVINQFKGSVTKTIGVSIWQKGFYDHIIRDEEDMYYHLQYIEENPKKWLMGKDEYYA